MRKYLLTVISCLMCCFAVAQGITTINGVKYYLSGGEAMIMDRTSRFRATL